MGLSKSDRIHAVLIRHFEVARETRSRWLSKSKVGLPVWGRICRYVKNASPKTVPQCTLTTISTRSPAQPQSGEYSSYFFQVVHLGNCWWIFLEPQGLYLRAKRVVRYRGKGDKKRKIIKLITASFPLKLRRPRVSSRVACLYLARDSSKIHPAPVVVRYPL